MQEVAINNNQGFMFPEFKNDSERIKKNTKTYKNNELVDAFEGVYGKDVVQKEKLATQDGQFLYITPMSPELDKVYFGQIVKYNKNGAEIFNPQFNERFLTKEDFTKYPLFDNYLLNNQNQVFFKVKKININKNTVEVNVLESYYDRWSNDMMKMVEYKRPLIVSNLRLMPGGFLGKIDIPYLSQMLGVDFYLDTFIPGSQIALNIEKDFNKWVDQNVEVLVNKFVKNNGRLSIMASRKRHLQNLGNINVSNLYSWRDNGDIYNTKYDGVVTGIINTNQKCGVFVEIPSENFTGLINIKNARDLVKYRPGMGISVSIDNFEVRENKRPIVYKKIMLDKKDQKKGQSKWVETDIIEFVNIKVNLKLA